MKSKSLTVFVAVLLSPFATGAVLTTVAATGYNQDVVVELGLLPTDTGFVNASFGSRAFFEKGTFGATAGMQASNSVTIGSDTVNFNFQPFTGSNALTATAGGAALTLSTPAFYSTLGFVSSSSAGTAANSTINFTINYATGAASTGSYTNTNWNGGEAETGTSDTLLTIAGRAATPATTGPGNTAPTSTTPFSAVTNEGGNWRIYLYQVAVDPTRQVTSVSFASATAGTDNKIFGIVGVIPEPSSAVFGIGAMALSLIVRRRK